MNVIKRDLIKLALDGRFDVIVHGCNCQYAMGVGIAKSIKETLPEAYKVDLATTKGSREKLGSISAATVTAWPPPAHDCQRLYAVQLAWARGSGRLRCRKNGHEGSESQISRAPHWLSQDWCQFG